MSEVIDIVLEANSNTLRVAMPGKELAYDSGTHKATVQPLIQYRMEGMEKPRSLDPIAGVPIIHPRSSAGSIFLPLSEGDMVTLLVSDRDLSRWKAGNGQETAPQIARAHDLADCWAYPGGYPDGMPPAPRFPGAVEIKLAPGTPFAVSNGTAELLDKLDELMDKLNDWITQDQLHTHATAALGPPVIPDPATLTVYALAQLAIAEVKSTLATMKA